METGSPAPDQDATDRRRREEAIRALAGMDGETPVATQEHGKQAIEKPSRATSRRLLLWGAGALIGISVIAIILVPLLRGASTAKPHASTRALKVIQFPVGQMACPLSASWSPDGKTLAVVGYAVCSAQEDAPQGTSLLVALINAATGRESSTLPLEAALMHSVTHGAALDTYALNLGPAVWTADGQTIGALFTLTPNTSPGQTTYGLVVLGVNGKVEVITPAAPLDQVGVSFETYNLDNIFPPLTVRFDLASQTANIVTEEPALAYQVGADGVLTPSLEGIPASLSGSVTEVCAKGGDAVAAGNTVYDWISAGGAAWSPDGSVFYSTLGEYGRLVGARLAAPTHPDPESSETCQTAGPSAKWSAVNPSLPALTNMASGLDPYHGAQFTFVTSPDGARVAILESGSTTASGAVAGQQTESVYDAATGKLVARFETPQLIKQAGITTNASGDLIVSMVWAPGATSLALLDSEDRALIILGPRQLD